ncbi:FecR family protein [Parapedobacter sp. 2B3]|uniref:FecR family protein n=1 Tax=Parapedobacter sp. 2B3 TaxID=3342381 RepID=UPI0035B5D638
MHSARIKIEHMISDRILQLLAKKMGQEASPEEEAELQDLLQKHPDHQVLMEILQSFEGERLHKEPPLGEDHLVREGWLMLQQELGDFQTTERIAENKEEKPARRFFSAWMSGIAVGIGLIFLGCGFYFIMNYGEPSSRTAGTSQVNVPNGMKVKKILPDSTIVWLNAGSHIRYDSNFVQKTRHVYLEGEAYFNVAHDKDHPFIVHAGNISVEALGTEFNVQAYQNTNKIEATLISGKVVVKIDGKPDHDIVLSPNEKLTVNNKAFRLPDARNTKVVTENPTAVNFEVEAVSEIPAIAMVPEVAWIQDKLAFENESFDELAKRMERRYDVHIIFEDDLLRNERLSGVFENENIHKALKLLQMTTGFQYRIEDDTVYVRR